MFTIKIEDQDGSARLFSWSQVISHGPLSAHFDTYKHMAIENAETSDVAEACQEYYAWLGDGDGNEYWLIMGEDCFITDGSGKTVLIHRSPEPAPSDYYEVAN